MKNWKNVVVAGVVALTVNVASAMVCVKIGDGKSYPFDKEAKDLVAALKPATNCSGKQVILGAKIMGKTIVERDATAQEATQVRAEIEKRANDRVKNRLLKKGLVK